MSKRKKSRSGSKRQAVPVRLEMSATAQEFFLPNERQGIVTRLVQCAMGKPGWAPGKTWETTIERMGQRFKAAVDNRRDGIYVLISRDHEMIHEAAPA